MRIPGPRILGAPAAAARGPPGIHARPCEDTEDTQLLAARLEGLEAPVWTLRALLQEMPELAPCADCMDPPAHLFL